MSAMAAAAAVPAGTGATTPCYPSSSWELQDPLPPATAATHPAGYSIQYNPSLCAAAPPPPKPATSIPWARAAAPATTPARPPWPQQQPQQQASGEGVESGGPPSPATAGTPEAEWGSQCRAQSEECTEEELEASMQHRGVSEGGFNDAGPSHARAPEHEQPACSSRLSVHVPPFEPAGTVQEAVVGEVVEEVEEEEEEDWPEGQVWGAPAPMYVRITPYGPECLAAYSSMPPSALQGGTPQRVHTAQPSPQGHHAESAIVVGYPTMSAAASQVQSPQGGTDGAATVATHLAQQRQPPPPQFQQAAEPCGHVSSSNSAGPAHAPPLARATAVAAAPAGASAGRPPLPPGVRPRAPSAAADSLPQWEEVPLHQPQRGCDPQRQQHFLQPQQSYEAGCGGLDREHSSVGSEDTGCAAAGAMSLPNLSHGGNGGDALEFRQRPLSASGQAHAHCAGVPQGSGGPAESLGLPPLAPSSAPRAVARQGASASVPVAASLQPVHTQWLSTHSSAPRLQTLTVQPLQVSTVV